MEISGYGGRGIKKELMLTIACPNALVSSGNR